MKQSSEYLKELIEENFNLSSKSVIKRKSKTKNDKKETVRIFEVTDNSNTFSVIVTTDINDEAVIGFEKSDTLSFKESEKVKESPFSKYIFAIDTKYNSDICGFELCIIRKSFWKKYKYMDDQPCKIEHLLPSFVQDLNESSNMAASVSNWKDAYDQLTELGIEYSNDVAHFLNKEMMAFTMFIKP